MDSVVIGTNWCQGNENTLTGCFEWNDNRIRKECSEGTERERQAYLASGYVLKPTEFPLDYVDNAPGGNITMVSCADVAKYIAAKHQITLAELRGQNRRPHIVVARREAVRICYVKLGKPLAAISRYFGRDSSTVLHYLRASVGMNRRVKSTWTNPPEW